MSDEEEFGELGAFDIINAVFLYLINRANLPRWFYGEREAKCEAKGEDFPG